MSDLTMMDVTRYVPLHQAHELAVRQSELYEAMRIVEECGASPELTTAVVKLSERMQRLQADLVSACKDATREREQVRDELHPHPAYGRTLDVDGVPVSYMAHAAKDPKTVEAMEELVRAAAKHMRDQERETATPDATATTEARRLPAGLHDQELGEEAAQQMEAILRGESGQPMRPAQDLPLGSLDTLRKATTEAQ